MKKQSFSSYMKGTFTSDLSSGLVVFLVAIPLCLGVALACGAPMMAGVIAGIVGGIVVGALGGSALGVSGPAAGLVTVVLAALAALGEFEVLLLATVLSGVIQVILGQLKAGIVAYYVPSSVITGMLAAIGIIIIMKELPYVVGYEFPPFQDLVLGTDDGSTLLTRLGTMFSSFHLGSVLIAVVGIVILAVWNIESIRRNRFLKILPGPLAAILAGIGLQILFTHFFPDLALTKDNLVQLPTDRNLESLIIFPDFSAITNGQVWFYAVLLALVASVETLVCAEATDKLDPLKRITPMNKELTAQGVANVVSGMLGGLPLTQVIVRSSANIQSGGKTRGAAIIHGFLILGAVLIFPVLMNKIPLASLAAILIMVGYRLVRPSIIKSMFNKGWSQFVPFAVTIIAILFTDLLIGVCIGIGVAVFLILRHNFRIPFSYHFEKSDNRPHIRMTLSEMVTFLNKGEILSTLQLIPDGSVLEIDATKSKVIDPDVMEVLEDFMENAKHSDIIVEMIGFDHEIKSYATPAKSLKSKLISSPKIAS